MSNGMPGTAKRNSGLLVWLTKLFESLGLLNAGSSESPATPSPDDAAKTTGVSSNTLNVTRVGGLAALIAAVGAAALALFNVNKAVDKPAIIVAAYASVGVIVASALLTAAIIISADIRSRTSTSNIVSAAAPIMSDTKSFDDAWHKALDLLKEALARLSRGTENPIDVWLDGVASTGITEQLHPASDRQETQARLLAGQSLILSKFEQLLDSPSIQQKKTTMAEIQALLDSMERSLTS